MTRKIHKSWIMAIIIALIMVMGFGLYVGTASVFIKVICDELSIPRGQYSIARMLIIMVSILMIPVIKKLSDRLGTKKVLLIAAAGMAASSALFSLCNNIWHFGMVCVFEGLFYNGINFFVTGTFIRRWFRDSVGLATSIAYCGTGLGGAIFSPVCTALIEGVGWRMTYLIMAGIGIVVIPLLISLLKDNPEDAGVEPYTKEKKENSREQLVIHPSDNDMTFGQVRKSFMFYVMIVVYVLIAIAHDGPWEHTTSYLIDSGFEPMTATTVNSCYLLCLTAAKIVFGVMFDKLGRRITGIIWVIALVAAPVTALFVNNIICLILYCICLGFAGGGYIVGMNLVIGDLVGQRAFADTLSICTMFYTFGSAVASPIMGAVYDMSGSYITAYIIILAMSVVAAAGIMYLSLKNSRKKV